MNPYILNYFLVNNEQKKLLIKRKMKVKEKIKKSGKINIFHINKFKKNQFQHDQTP